MGLHKKIREFALSSSGTYGFPIEEHTEYWIKKYEKDLELLIESTKTELRPLTAPSESADERGEGR